MSSSRNPVLQIPPIAKLKSLGSILELSETALISMAGNVDELWKQGKLLKKKNGDPRPTHDAHEPLKAVHEHIKNRILKKVDYPIYMQGGIADERNPRSCRSHALVHSGKRILIAEDIKDFFPSSNITVVQGIWQYCFHFSPDVVDVLTRLTTYQGCLPQGWKTSGYLANLVFWDKEPELVELLEERGFFYSRFMDDITVSSRRPIANKEKNFIITNIYEMLFSKGYAPKRSKHEILTANEPMQVTGLTVNGRRPTVPLAERNNVRAMIFQLEKHLKKDRSTKEYCAAWKSLSGRVGRIRPLHPTTGEKLRARLKEIKPSKEALRKWSKSKIAERGKA